MIIFILVLVALAGCGNASDELNGKSNNRSQITNKDDDVSNKDLTAVGKDITEGTEKTNNSYEDTIDTENKKATITETVSNNVLEKPSTYNTKSSLKEEYLQKVNHTTRVAEELEASDSSTYAMKKVENDRWNIWDELLNEVYEVLKGQLSPEEMDQLREEQRNWVKYRDDSSLEASLKYKGGTQEQLEYVIALANFTEERCYELVETYME